MTYDQTNRMDLSPAQPGRRAFLSTATASLALAGLGAGLGGCAAGTRAGAGPAGSVDAGTPSGAVAGSAAGERRLRTIGIQLYTVRDAYRADPYGTVRMLGELGYNEIEYANMDNLPISPAEFRRACDGAGIRVPATHFNPPVFADTPQRVVDIAGTLGCTYVVNSWIDAAQRTRDGYLRQAEWFNRVGSQMRAAGLRYGYHNHDFEFAAMDGARTGLDLLFANTDRAVVEFELDMYWVVNGGGDNLEIMRRNPGRIKTCHVKDRTSDGRMVNVGQGVIPWAAIFSEYQAAGIEHFFVEHDEPPAPVRDSVKSSIDWLRALRF